jgi:sigma-B regulation protein RsbU (phosphoserine phosphatase)
MSILTKFSLAVIALLLLSAGSVAWLGVQSQREALQAEAIQRSSAIARSLAAASADALATGDPLTLVNLAVDAKAQNRDVVYAALVDNSGRVAGHADRAALGRPFALEGAKDLTALGEGVRQGTYNGELVWDLAVAVLPKGAKGPVGQAHVALSQVQVLASIRSVAVRQSLLALLLLGVGAGLSVALVGLLVKPLRALSEAARLVGAGDFSVQVAVPSKDEVGQLIERFNHMTANLETAQRERIDKERMQGELNVARSIQANLLPTQAPDLKGWELAFHCNPAKELGGDFYDWFMLAGGTKLGLVIADVSGKGVPAALHMANLRNLTRFAAKAGKGPAATLKAVNEAAFPDLKGESFVTLLYAEIDLATRKGVLVSAGHEPALLVNGATVEGIRAKGMPIGVAEPEDFDFIVKETAFQMAAGEQLVLYTDGVTEAMNAQEVQFGRERLDASVKSGASARATLDKLLADVHAHAAGFEQSDDLTALVLRLGA